MTYRDEEDDADIPSQKVDRISDRIYSIKESQRGDMSRCGEWRVRRESK